MNMKQTGLLIFIIALAAFVAGCGGATANNNANLNNAPTATTNDSQTQTAAATTNSNTASANVPGGETVAADVNATTNAPAKGKANAAPPTKMPSPQVGTGANDFYLFTKVRGAIDSDSELKTSAVSVIVNVSDGNIRLTGGVADEKQKAKVEQLARAAEGVKSVKNELRVGAVASPR